MSLRAWGSDSGRKRALGCCLTIRWTVGFWDESALATAAKLRAGGDSTPLGHYQEGSGDCGASIVTYVEGN